jgi:ATP-dependent HslUV protease subunit HslV
VRRLGKGEVIAGFAGATADAFTCSSGWKQARAISGAADPRLRRTRQGLAHRPLSAPAGGDDDRRRQAEVSLVLTGTGDVLEPEHGVIGIGSGGNYALAAARALIDIDGLDAEAIARRAMAHRRRHLRLHQPQRDR